MGRHWNAGSALICTLLAWTLATPRATQADDAPPLNAIEVALDARAQNGFAQVEHAVAADGTVTWQQAARGEVLTFAKPEAPRIGHDRAHHWLRFRVRNTHAATFHGTIELHRGNNILDADMYIVDGNRLEGHWSHGVSDGGGARPLPVPQLAFPLDLASGAERTVLIRMHSGIYYLRAEPRVWERQAFFDQAQKSMGVGWAFHGLMLVLALYNLIVFWTIRDRVYLWYVAWTLGGLAMNSTRSGLALMLTPASFYEWVWRPTPFVMLCAVMQFTRLLLDTRSHSPRMDRVLHWLSVATGVWIVGSLIAPNMVSEVMLRVLALPVFGSALYAGYLSVKARIPVAKLYLSTYAVQYAGVVANIFAMTGLIPANLFTTNLNRMGVALQMVLFALALAQRYSEMRNRLNQEQSERIAAQTEALKVKEEAAANLERKVEERTAQLAEKGREMEVMLDSLDQGVFTLDTSLQIQPQYSEHLDDILGESDLVGRDGFALLMAGAKIGTDAQHAAKTALECILDAPEFLAESNSHLLIREFERVQPSGELRTFEVDWNWIVDDNEDVQKVLVAVRDVTSARAEKAAAARKARELDIVGQILEVSIDTYGGFHQTATSFLQDVRETLSREEERSDALLERLFRAMHTVKGNARLHKFDHLVDAVHQAEESYAQLRSDPAQPWDRERLRAELGDVEKLIEEYDAICTRKLAPLLKSDGGVSSVALQELEKISGELRDGSVENRAEGFQRMRRVLMAATAVSLEDLTLSVTRGLDSLAEELGKPMPEVDLKTVPDRLSSEWSGTLRDIFVHCFRNSIDHGLESSDERLAQGKPEVGRLRVRSEMNADSMRIRLSDDGRGLAVDRLRAKASDPGCSDELAAELVFQSGVSTAEAVTEVSGRGMGMDAVRQFVREQGGDIALCFTGDKNAQGYRPFELTITIPPAGVVANDTTSLKTAA